MKTYSFFLTILCAALLTFAVGCDATNPDADAEANASEDVAASVASLVSEDTGGLLEQVSDVFDLAKAGGIQAQSAALAGKYADGTSLLERTYDETTGTWTITLDTTFTSDDGLRSASISRIYEVQFLGEDGAPQQFFVTNGDTAHSISFTIVEGSGALETPHLSAERSNITGQWMATGVHTDVVTVNGSYGRSGAHTLTTQNAVRTLDYDLTLDVIDVVGPKGSRRDLTQKISGRLEGVYEGKATFTRGDLYREREISRVVTIVIDDGVLTITVNGEPFEGNARTGAVVG